VGPFSRALKLSALQGTRKLEYRMQRSATSANALTRFLVHLLSEQTRLTVVEPTCLGVSFSGERLAYGGCSTGGNTEGVDNGVALGDVVRQRRGDGAVIPATGHKPVLGLKHTDAW
jgi:hypothetical protein